MTRRFNTWVAVLLDPDGNECERVTGTPQQVAEAARLFIFNMTGDDETPLACSVEVFRP